MTTSFRLFFSRKPTICTKTLHSLQGQSLGFHCLMAFSYLCESLISFRLLGTRSHIFGPRFEILSVLFFFFFLSGFSSQTLTIHGTAGERRGPSFISFYHFHPLTNIETFIWNFASEITITYF